MKHLFLFIMFSCCLCFTASAENFSECYKNLPVKMQQVSKPLIPERTLQITSFGGVGNGITSNTEAFKKAIDKLEALGGGTLNVPMGIWLTGPITLKSNIRLNLERNAIILSTPDKNEHLIYNNGKLNYRCAALLNARDCKNIAITGEGTIDGNGTLWRPAKRIKMSDTEWKELMDIGEETAQNGSIWMPYNLKHYKNILDIAEKQEALRQDIIRFENCQNIMFQGVTVQNSPRFHVHPIECKNVIFDGIVVRCEWNAQNGDAIDISNCQTVLIKNCIVNAGDDGICMKGGVGLSGIKKGPCKDILITDNTVYHAHGGFVIGSDVSGGMENIVVRRCRFSSTDVGLRFKSGLGRGGKTKNIFIDDIVMTDIKDEAIIFDCTYIDRTWNYRENNDKKKTTEFTPEFQDIHINNVVSRNSKYAIRGVGLKDMQCVKNINIKNSYFFYNKKDKEIDENCNINFKKCIFETYKD